MENEELIIINGVIYIIFCNDEGIEEFYIGSTSNFEKRKTNHRFKCNDSINYNYKVYQKIRENGGFDNWSMVVLQHCSNFDELKLLEQEYFEALKPTLNTYFPIRLENRDWRIEYYRLNKEKITMKRRANAEKKK